MKDSPLKNGIREPNHIENAIILLANTIMDINKVNIYDAQHVFVDSISKFTKIEGGEKEKHERKDAENNWSWYKLFFLTLNIWLMRNFLHWLLSMLILHVNL